jgi:sec-independent protein translocase protein TatB
MFGIGFPELLLILALALIVVGPDKLPDIARSIAKTLVDLKKTAEGLKESFEEEDNPLNEIKPQLEEAAKNFKETVLDEKSQTWKSPSDMPDLKSVIDATTLKTDEEQSPAEDNQDQETYISKEDGSKPETSPQTRSDASTSSPENSADSGDEK